MDRAVRNGSAGTGAAMRNDRINATGLLLLASGLIAAALVYKTIFMPAAGYDFNFGYLWGRDFPNFWMGGVAAASGKIAVLTDIDAYNVWLHQLFGGEAGLNDRYVFSYPPSVLPLLAPLGTLGYGTALYLYSALSLALAGLMGWWLSGRERMGAVLMALSPGLLVTVFFGHPDMFLAALLVPGLFLMERRPVIAGLLLGLATVKPQLGLVIALILLVRLNWRAIVAALASAVALVGLSVALYGTAPWLAYFSVIVPFEDGVPKLIYLRHLFYFTPTAFAVFAWLRLPFDWAMALQLACGAVATFTAVYIWIKAQDETMRSLAVLLATALLLPYVNVYDLTVVALAQVAFLFRSPAALHMPRPLHAVLWVVPAVSPLLAIAAAPLGALGLAWGLFSLAALARRGESGYIE